MKASKGLFWDWASEAAVSYFLKLLYYLKCIQAGSQSISVFWALGQGLGRPGPGQGPSLMIL